MQTPSKTFYFIILYGHIFLPGHRQFSSVLDSWILPEHSSAIETAKSPLIFLLPQDGRLTLAFFFSCSVLENPHSCENGKLTVFMCKEN